MSPTIEPHSARYLALLYSAEPQRATLEALFGIEREIFESLRPGMEHQVAHSRLQWWRDECGRTSDGHPVHPLTRTLVDTVPLPALRGLSGFVDDAIWDLASATFESRRELTAYCERWAAAMIEPFASTTSAPLWRKIGTAMREIELVGDLAREAHYGRLRLPLDELDHSKAPPGVLAEPPWPDGVTEILRARHKILRNEIAAALTDLGGEAQPALRGLFVWIGLMWRCSLRAQRVLPDSIRPRQFDAMSDAWFAWRVARKATMGRFTLELG